MINELTVTERSKLVWLSSSALSDYERCRDILERARTLGGSQRYTELLERMLVSRDEVVSVRKELT